MFGLDATGLGVRRARRLQRRRGRLCLPVQHASPTRRTPDKRLDTVKRAETDRASRQGLARPRRRGRQAPQVGSGFAEGARRRSRRPRTQHQEAAAEDPDPAGRHADHRSSASTSIRSICGIVADASSPCSSARRFDRPAGRVCWPARSACRAGSSSFRRARRVKAFLERVSQRARRHRARRQVRPAAQRRHPADRQRSRRSRCKTEFRRIVEAQQVGMSIPEAALRMSETMPCPEAGFFGIVIQIQQQAGGNLSEALGNLSRVLRDRKKMKAKVQALSMEAKASAAIIGALPFIVALPRLPDQPRTTSCRCSRPAPAISSSALRHLDVDRHLRDAQDDEFRGLEARSMTDQVVKAAHRSGLPDRPAGRHRRLRDLLHPDAGA